MPTILGMPRWLAFSLLTILVWGAWGAVSKVASEGVDANTNQVFFTFGLLPLIALVWRSPRNAAGGAGRRVGHQLGFLDWNSRRHGKYRFLSRAMVMGGKASIVSPVTALFPLVTVILAVTFLQERVGTTQKIGLSAGAGCDLSIEHVRKLCP